MYKQEEVEGKAMVQKYQFLMAGPSHQVARPTWRRWGPQCRNAWRSQGGAVPQLVLRELSGAAESRFWQPHLEKRSQEESIGGVDTAIYINRQ